MIFTKTLVFLAMLMAFVSVVQGAVGIEKVVAAPDDPNTCYRESDQLKLAIGETTTGPDCARLECLKVNDEYFIEIAGCDKVGAEPPCIIVPGTDPDYPGCCETVKCD